MVFPLLNSGAGAPHTPGKGEAPSETCLQPWAVKPYVTCITIVLGFRKRATSARLTAPRPWLFYSFPGRRTMLFESCRRSAPGRATIKLTLRDM
jgi:hypothetical protein